MKKRKLENRPKKKVSKKKAIEKEKCFHCNSNGHWKRNYPHYLASLKNKKDSIPSEGMSNLLVIKTNLMVSFTSNWIIESGSSAYLCTFMQDLKDNRRLREGEMTLRVENGARVTAVVIGTYSL